CNVVAGSHGGPYSQRSDLIQEARDCCKVDWTLGEPMIQGRVAAFMGHDFADCAVMFEKVDTLESELTEEQANRIFRLGQYLAILNWDDTKHLLDAFEMYRRLGKALKVTV